MRDGGFTYSKRWANGLIGLGVLVASIIFSREGFGFKEGTYGWVGWLLAFAATAAQFMMTSDFRKINFSILFLGIVSYLYSVYTNIAGFHVLRGTANEFDFFNVVGGIFMDVYPEVAISWALGESKIGDLFGNLFKSFRDPKELTHNDTVSGFKNGAYDKLPKRSYPEKTSSSAPWQRR